MAQHDLDGAREQVAGVYEGGVIRLERPLDLEPGTTLRLDVAVEGGAAVIAGTVVDDSSEPPPAREPAPPRDRTSTLAPPANDTGEPRPGPGRRRPWSAAASTVRAMRTRSVEPAALDTTRPWLVLALAATALLLFAATRFVGLTRFPIYFFTDEAIHPNWAAYLLGHGFRDPGGVLLPPFFKNDQTWNLSASVYTHLLPVALFGRSVLVTRAVPALLSIFAAAGLGFASWRAFGHRSFWLTPLLMAAMPAWFLHSRAGFETALATSYFALFLMAYLLYRQGRPRWILAALPLGAAAAYSYASAQLLMVGTGLLLLLVDARYHVEQFRKHSRVMIGAAALMVLLMAPYLRFRVLEPDATANHLKTLRSYLVADTPPGEKVRTFLGYYLDGLEPTYWFGSDHQRDIERHRMKGMAALSPLLAPLIGVGLLVSARRIVRSPAHRAVLIALLVVPVGAALVAPGITRLLAMMVPATLLAAIGVDWVLQRVTNRRAYALAAAVVAITLAMSGVSMTRAALRDAPTWFSDYGIYGTQWGAPQVFAAIDEELEKSKATHVLMSPTWANNPDAFVAFFLDAEKASRVDMASIYSFLQAPLDIDPDLLLVLPDDEYRIAQASDKLELALVREIDLPDGKPGFHFLRIRYVPDVAARFEADRQARLALVESTVWVGGEVLTVRHSKLDMGDMPNAFDGNVATLVRGAESNPFSIEVIFPSPLPLRMIAITTGSMDIGLRVQVWPSTGGEPWELEQSLRSPGDDPRVEVPLPESLPPTARVHFDIKNLNDGDVSHVHLRELDWR